MSASIAVLVVVSLPGIAVAKGPLAAIEFSGPGFEQTLSVTEGDALLDFNPWGQEFLGARLDSKPSGLLEPLTVTMYLDNSVGTLEAIYRFEYYPAPDGGRIYLPGPGDADYDLNKTTILGGGGNWFDASPSWDSLYQRLVSIRPPSTGNGGLK
jgi:hypothetical protein